MVRHGYLTGGGSGGGGAKATAARVSLERAMGVPCIRHYVSKAEHHTACCSHLKRVWAPHASMPCIPVGVPHDVLCPHHSQATAFQNFLR